MEYEKVPHSHIVPAGYLRAWANADDLVGMRIVGQQTSKAIGVGDAGVRSNFYRRTRPDTGETIYDVEWSLRQLENAAIPVIRRLAAPWPLDTEERGKAAQFFATQYVRGPAFKRWHEQHLQPMVDELREDPEEFAAPPPAMTGDQAIERAIEYLSGDTWRLMRMLSITRLLTTAFMSMHWTLVAFDRPRLVTSDHPLVVWPLRRAHSQPVPNDIDAGIVHTLEAFIPIDPSHLLLMTWLDEPDDPEVARGLGRHIATANAFVVANADAQWFHQPDVTPWRLTKGRRGPLSADLVAGYNAEVAMQSQRRNQATAIMNANAGVGPSNDPISVVTVTPPT